MPEPGAAIQLLRNGRQRLRDVRRSTMERVGVDRYSRPSLHSIEERLDDLFRDRPSGFFVEAGAFDGYRQSNTYWLERFRGWKGILIEPVPEHAEACRRLRKRATTVQRALVDGSSQEESTVIRYAGLMSIVRGARQTPEADDDQVRAGLRVQPGLSTYEVVVPTATLTDVLAESGAPSRFDLLSLDVEGYEAQVLKGLNFDRFAPSYILVEMNFPDDVHRLLTTQGYRLEDRHFTSQDALYRRA